MCAMSPRLLRPIASGVHPEAADWRARVIANGGTVSGSTLQAVSRLCTSISSAGIRDRFYRLGIFAGDNLNAALVPLYRGPTFGGTTYGNATDTNNAFVGVGTDYAETGASGGLTGNGSTKWLNPGKQADIKPGWSTHHFGIDIKDAYPDATTRYQIGAFFNEGVTSPRGHYTMLGTSSQRQVRSGQQIRFDATANDALRIAVRASATDFRVYENGVQAGGTSTGSDTSTVLPDAPFAIMASSYQNVSAGVPTTVVTGYQPAVGIARGYTIGESMTAAQVLDFYSAWSAFQSALGRT